MVESWLNLPDDIKPMPDIFNIPALIYPWIDLLWLPIGVFVAHRGQRVKTAGFILCSIMIFRMQLELMASIGYPDGFLQWIDLGLYERGLMIYGGIFALFLVLTHFSPNTKGAVFLAAALSMIFLGFCISMVAMLL